MSLSEPFQKPTTMLYRNLLAMETEELLRSYPADGCVLMGGCDKTTPALLMGAVSMDLPTLPCRPAPCCAATGTATRWAPGPTPEVLGRAARGQHHRGRLAGAWRTASPAFARPLHDHGHGLHHDRRGRGGYVPVGLLLDSGARLAPRADGEPVGQAHRRNGLGRPQAFGPADRRVYDNAVRTVLALSGSTNSVVHLIAMARRSGFGLDLDRFDHLARTTPVLANLRPAGKYLMEDFYYAGGLRALLVQLGDLLDLSQRTVDGRTLGENTAGARVFNDDVIARADRRWSSATARPCCAATWRRTAVIKPPAMEAHLQVHTGPAVVFSDYNDMAARIDDPALDVSADSVIVLQNAGPQGAPGMPEWGSCRSRRSCSQGVRDMVRISDARMSGTSYGACVLHVAPEAYVGGPLALVRDGDMVALDVPGRSLNLLVPDAELAARKAAWQAPPPRFALAMACCPRTSVRPIRAAISIFCRPKRALNPRANRRFIDPGDGRNVHAPKAASDGAGLPFPDRAAHVETVQNTRRRHTWNAMQRGAPAPGAGRADRGGGRGDARRAVRADRAMADAARQAGGAVPARGSTDAIGGWRSNWPRIWARPSSSRTRAAPTAIWLGRGGKAEPDGCTLLLSGVGSNAINYALYASMPYRDSDFAHVCCWPPAPTCWWRRRISRQDLRGLHPAGAREPGQVHPRQLGQRLVRPPGHGNAQAAGQDRSVHVPYKGGAAAITDLLGGRVTVLFLNQDTLLPQVQAGKLRALAVASVKRNPAYPDTPTVAESGYPGFAAESWFGLSAPGRRPP